MNYAFKKQTIMKPQVKYAIIAAVVIAIAVAVFFYFKKKKQN